MADILTPNYAFTSTVDGWSDTNHTATWSAGKLALTPPGSGSVQGWAEPTVDVAVNPGWKYDFTFKGYAAAGQGGSWRVVVRTYDASDPDTGGTILYDTGTKTSDVLTQYDGSFVVPVDAGNDHVHIYLVNLEATDDTDRVVYFDDVVLQANEIVVDLDDGEITPPAVVDAAYHGVTGIIGGTLIINNDQYYWSWEEQPISLTIPTVLGSSYSLLSGIIFEGELAVPTVDIVTPVAFDAGYLWEGETTVPEMLTGSGIVEQGAQSGNTEGFNVLSVDSAGIVGLIGGLDESLAVFVLDFDDRENWLDSDIQTFTLDSYAEVVYASPTTVSVDLSIPVFLADSIGEISPTIAENIINYVLHLHRVGMRDETAITRYTSNCNSHAVLDGKVYAASADGVFMRGGFTDNGARYKSIVKREGHDAGNKQSKGFTAAYLRGVFDGGYRIIVTADGKSGETTVDDGVAIMHGSKATLPRGVRGRELGWAIESDAPFDLRAAEFVLDISPGRSGRQT